MYTREPRCHFELLTELPYDEVRLIIRDLMTQNYHVDGKLVLMGVLDTFTIGGQPVTRYRGKADPRSADEMSYGFEIREWIDALSVYRATYGAWEPDTDRDRYLRISCQNIRKHLPKLLRRFKVVFGEPEVEDLYCIHLNCPHVVPLTIVPILGPCDELSRSLTVLSREIHERFDNGDTVLELFNKDVVEKVKLRKRPNAGRELRKPEAPVLRSR